MSLKRASKRVVVISEQVNRYGFRALVDGIELSHYEANPIMLWMHIRAFGSNQKSVLPIGNVIELRVEEMEGVGKVITGQPMFDLTDDFAKSIYNKFENGTIRMASAGLIPVDWSEEMELLLPGQRAATLVKSILEEISIVDIGADTNAIALYDRDRNRIELSLDSENALIPLVTNSNFDMSKIELSAAKAAALLGVREIDTTDAFETKVAEVVQLAARQKTQIEKLTREKSDLEAKVTASEKAALDEKTNVLLNAAEADRKIVAGDRSFYADQIKTESDYQRVKLHLDSKGGSPTVQSVLTGEKPKNVSLYAGKTWDELDEADLLIQLKSDDLNLFKQLYKNTFGKEYSA